MTAYANGCFVDGGRVGDGFNGGLDVVVMLVDGVAFVIEVDSSGARFDATYDLEVTTALT